MHIQEGEADNQNTAWPFVQWFSKYQGPYQVPAVNTPNEMEQPNEECREEYPGGGTASPKAQSLPYLESKAFSR